MNGWQQQEYLQTDLNQLPMELAIGTSGQPVNVQIETRSGLIRAKVWRVKVGRCDLLLLDSNVAGNAPEDLETTSRLYGGDARTRIRQELLLGVGGFRALKAMGISPGVLHLNEGHSAFALFEAIRSRMEEEGLDFYGAATQIPREVIFTTHTPVPAGHDPFPADLVEEHIVQLREDSLPIGHITNGLHVPSWLAPQMCRLYDRHLGVGWQNQSGSKHTWEAIESVDDGELWETHLSLKAQLLEFVRRRAREQAARRDESHQALQRLGKVLSPAALTIGFARRFATYKRANLLLKDIERLASMVNDPKRPVQVLFAGTAHPHDEPGKRVLQQIAEMMRDSSFEEKFLFIEDYDINVGRHLVQGV